MDTCQPTEGIHRIPKGSELCLCGRTSRTFPDTRAFDAWKRVWDSAAADSLANQTAQPAAAAVPAEAALREPEASAPVEAALPEPKAAAPVEAALPAPEAAAAPAEAPALVEPPPAAEPAKPTPKKGRSKAAPAAP